MDNNMKIECRDTIYSYANTERQLSAALTGEHKEYVMIVLQLLKDEYHRQVDKGNTSFVFEVNSKIAITLDAMNPWKVEEK